MLDALLKLIDKAIAFIREGESRRASFFTEIVEPIHQTFGQFCDEHLATFDEILKSLADQSIPLKDILATLDRKETLERGSWLIFERLEEIGRASKASLDDHYTDYITALGQCLFQTQRSPQTSIVFYGTLQDKLEGAVSRLRYIESPGSEPRIRDTVRDSLEDVVARFHNFRTDVDAAYLCLKQHCMT